MNLYNQNVLIIGIGSGIGRALAFEFLKERSNIIALDHDKEVLAEIEREIGNRRGKIRSFRGDLSVRKDAERIMKDILHQHDTVDLVVFADRFESGVSFDQMGSEDAEKLIARTFGAVVWTIKYFVQQMNHKKEGGFIWIPPFLSRDGADRIMDAACTNGTLTFIDMMRQSLKKKKAPVSLMTVEISQKWTGDVEAASEIVRSFVKGKSAIKI
jgi:NADP-dependent 3-hydroxy acid dehydrogenase YdfG